jgi:hypothetical protein
METIKKERQIILTVEGKEYKAEVFTEDDTIFFSFYGHGHRALCIPFKFFNNFKVVLAEAYADIDKGKPNKDGYNSGPFFVKVEKRKKDFFINVKYVEDTYNTYLKPAQEFTIHYYKEFFCKTLEDLKNLLNSIKPDTIETEKEKLIILKNNDIETHIHINKTNPTESYFHLYRVINTNGLEFLRFVGKARLCDLNKIKEITESVLEDFKKYGINTTLIFERFCAAIIKLPNYHNEPTIYVAEIQDGKIKNKLIEDIDSIKEIWGLMVGNAFLTISYNDLNNLKDALTKAVIIQRYF